MEDTLEIKKKRGRKSSNKSQMKGDSVVENALPIAGASAITLVGNKALNKLTERFASTNSETYAAVGEVIAGVAIDELYKGDNKLIRQTGDVMAKHGLVEVMDGVAGGFIDSAFSAVQTTLSSWFGGGSSTTASNQAALAQAAAYQAALTQGNTSVGGSAGF